MSLHRCILGALVVGALSLPAVAQQAPRTGTAASAAESARLALRTRQFSAAVSALRPPAEAGDADACYLLGLALASGYLGNPDHPQARRWLERAATQRHAAAAFALAGSWAQHAPTDPANAARWLAVAADLGYPAAIDLSRSKRLPLAPQRPPMGDEQRLKQAFAIRAARLGDVAGLAAVGAREAIGLRDEQGRATLSHAAQSGAKAGVAWLLEAGADANASDLYGITPLMLAAAQPDVDVTRALLAAGASVTVRDHSGRNALMHAAWADRATQVDVLVAAGGPLDAVDARGWTALDIAVQRGRDAASAALRAHRAPARAGDRPPSPDSGVDLNRTGILYAGWPALLLAVSRDEAETVRGLLADAGNLDAKSPTGQTALHIAVEYRALQSLRLLVDAGMDPLRPDPSGESAIDLAARRRDLAMLDLLLEQASARRAASQSYDPILFRAAARGHADVVQLLLRRGANPNAVDRRGTTALLFAVGANDRASVAALLAAGAGVDSTDARGRSPLWHATAGGAEELVTLLLANRARPAAADRTGVTPLIVAARIGSTTIAKALLDAGVNASATDRSGNSAVHAAAGGGHCGTITLLLQAGAEVDPVNAAGETPLISAARGGHAGCVGVLLRAGASRQTRNNDRLSARDVAELLGHQAIATQLN